MIDRWIHSLHGVAKIYYAGDDVEAVSVSLRGLVTDPKSTWVDRFDSLAPAAQLIRELQISNALANRRTRVYLNMVGQPNEATEIVEILQTMGALFTTDKNLTFEGRREAADGTEPPHVFVRISRGKGACGKAVRLWAERQQPTEHVGWLCRGQVGEA